MSIQTSGKGDRALAAVPSPRSLVFGAIHLTSEGLEVHGKPEFTDWKAALSAAVYLSHTSPFWKADLLEYASTREDWAKRRDQVIDAGTFTKATIDEYRRVSRAVPLDRRVEGVTFAHHQEVAALPAGDQTAYLKRAKREHLSVAELRTVIKKERKVRRILKGQSSELAKAHDAVVEYAHAAADVCRAIPLQDCKDAERLVTKARTVLDKCETAIERFRKAQGKTP